MQKKKANNTVLTIVVTPIKDEPKTMNGLPNVVVVWC